MNDPDEFDRQFRDRDRLFNWGMIVCVAILGVGFLALWQMTLDTRRDVNRILDVVNNLPDQFESRTLFERYPFLEDLYAEDLEAQTPPIEDLYTDNLCEATGGLWATGPRDQSSSSWCP